MIKKKTKIRKGYVTPEMIKRSAPTENMGTIKGGDDTAFHFKAEFNTATDVWEMEGGELLTTTIKIVRFPSPSYHHIHLLMSD